VGEAEEGRRGGSRKTTIGDLPWRAGVAEDGWAGVRSGGMIQTDGRSGGGMIQTDDQD